MGGLRVWNNFSRWKPLKHCGDGGKEGFRYKSKKCSRCSPDHDHNLWFQDVTNLKLDVCSQFINSIFITSSWSGIENTSLGNDSHFRWITIRQISLQVKPSLVLCSIINSVEQLLESSHSFFFLWQVSKLFISQCSKIDEIESGFPNLFERMKRALFQLKYRNVTENNRSTFSKTTADFIFPFIWAKESLQVLNF